jgi:hypothetical protein
MRDGEHKPCPIVDDEAIKVPLADGDYLMVTATHDSLQFFPDHRYNNLRYYDSESGEIKIVFLPEEMMSQLYEMGIPPTQRESITVKEYQLFEQHMGMIALSEEVELVEVEPPSLSDAEIDYYLQEWEN